MGVTLNNPDCLYDDPDEVEKGGGLLVLHLLHQQPTEAQAQPLLLNLK